MTLKDLLGEKSSKLYTCNGNNTVSEAVSLMEKNNIGSILVVDEKGDVEGIFTERDVLRCAARKTDLDVSRMADVMSKDPVLLDVSTDVENAVNVMSKGNFRHLPVTDKGKLIGMVSYRDLVAYLLPEIIFTTDNF